jgi:hypothetical protein
MGGKEQSNSRDGAREFKDNIFKENLPRSGNNEGSQQHHNNHDRNDDRRSAASAAYPSPPNGNNQQSGREQQRNRASSRPANRQRSGGATPKGDQTGPRQSQLSDYGKSRPPPRPRFSGDYRGKDRIEKEEERDRGDDRGDDEYPFRKSPAGEERKRSHSQRVDQREMDEFIPTQEHASSQRSAMQSPILDVRDDDEEESGVYQEGHGERPPRTASPFHMPPPPRNNNSGQQARQTDSEAPRQGTGKGQRASNPQDEDGRSKQHWKDMRELDDQHEVSTSGSKGSGHSHRNPNQRENGGRQAGSKGDRQRDQQRSNQSGKHDGNREGKGDDRTGPKGKGKNKGPLNRLPSNMDEEDMRAIVGHLVSEQRATSALLREIVRSEFHIFEVISGKLITDIHDARRNWADQTPATGRHPLGGMDGIMWEVVGRHVQEYGNPTVAGRTADLECLALSNLWAENRATIQVFRTLGTRPIRAGPPPEPLNWLFQLKLGYTTPQSQLHRASLLGATHVWETIGCKLRSDTAPKRTAEKILGSVRLW